MKIISIKLKNFKNFRQKQVNLSNMTFIKGQNGSGKSTIALDSILFGFWGYTMSSSLKDLPTRNVSKSCIVEIEVEKDNNKYLIHREYPTKIKITKNEEELEFASSREAQRFIDKTFGDRIGFQKFRMIDAYTKDTNFLEEGQTTIKKIIFGSTDELFNNIRKKLLKIKHEREIYNKDKAVTYKHYPSEERLKKLKKGISILEDKKKEILNEYKEFENEHWKLAKTLNCASANINKINTQIEKTKSRKTCYACKQEISSKRKEEILKELNAELSQEKETAKTVKPDLKNVTEIKQMTEKQRENVVEEIQKAKTWQMKLEGRLGQKEYKYSEKDVLIAKNAISEVDKLSSYYLTESIKVLEPIINDILAKIGFIVSFELDDKNKFNIKLEKEEIEYNYKDLSTGQKLILQIAFKLALLMERDETGFVVADEGMSSLDSENLQHILTIFNNMPYQLVFVIHNLEDVPEYIKTINLDNKNDTK